MATIGTFTSNGNGFTGTIKTLNLNVKARIERVETPSDKGPQFRIFSGAVELGAAWPVRSTTSWSRFWLSARIAVAACFCTVMSRIVTTRYACPLCTTRLSSTVVKKGA